MTSDPESAKPAHSAKIILLLALTLLPYLFTLHHDFVYDDHGQIEENTFLENPGNLAKVILLETLDDPKIINGRRPYVLVTYFIDRKIWKDAAGGYRMTNLFYHFGTMILLFFLIRRLAKGRDDKNAPTLFAFVAVLIFSLHPLLIESVHMPAFRPDILYIFFTLAYLSLLTSKVLLSGPRAAFGLVAAALLMLLLALSSKEAGVIGPVLLVLIWGWFPSTRPTRKTMAFGLGLSGLVILGFAALCAGSGSFQGATGSWNGLSLKAPENFFTSPWLWVKYLQLMLVPFPLIIDRIVSGVSSPLDLKFISGLMGLLLTVAAIFVCRKKHLFVSFGLAWMLVVFLPVSNLVPLFNPMSERLTYGMVVGFGMILSYVLVYRGFKNVSRPGLRKGILGAYCAFAAVLTFIRLQDFQNDETLWQATLKHEPRSARAHTYVGLNYRKNNLPEKALEHFNRAAELNPRDVASLINAGIIYGGKNDLEAAAERFREAIRRKPENANAHFNLAFALKGMGKNPEALAALEATLKIEPTNLKAMKAKLTMLLHATQYQEALKLAEQILKITPDDKNLIGLKTMLAEQLRQRQKLQ